MNDVIKALDDAVSIIEEMKVMLTEGDSDAPLAFLEASQDVQHNINRAVQVALMPILRRQQ